MDGRDHYVIIMLGHRLHYHNPGMAKVLAKLLTQRLSDEGQ